MKNVKEFQIKTVILTNVKRGCMLHGRVFVMFFFSFFLLPLELLTRNTGKSSIFSSKLSFFLLKEYKYYCMHIFKHMNSSDTI